MESLKQTKTKAMLSSEVPRELEDKLGKAVCDAIAAITEAGALAVNINFFLPKPGADDVTFMTVATNHLKSSDERIHRLPPEDVVEAMAQAARIAADEFRAELEEAREHGKLDG